MKEKIEELKRHWYASNRHIADLEATLEKSRANTDLFEQLYKQALEKCASLERELAQIKARRHKGMSEGGGAK